MKVPPHPGLSTVMPHSDYQLGSWGGWPLQAGFGDAPVCPKCHTVVFGPVGDHLVSCRQNNFTAGHGALQDALLLVLGLAKQPAEREQALSTNSSRVIRQQLRPADILLRNWAGGRDVAVDLTIVHPLQVGETPWSADRVKSLLRRKETAKSLKYEDACRQEGWGFLPVAFSTWATAGPSAFDLLQRILPRPAAGADADDRSARLSELRDVVSQAVMRQVVRLLAPILTS